MARYEELSRVLANSLNVRLHETARKSSVFRRCLTISSEGAERAVDGKLFHARAAATLKALSVPVAAERRRRRESRAETRCSMFARYDGARTWKQR